MPIQTPEENPAPVEVPASAAEEASAEDALVQHPTFEDQVLSIPADKLDEYKDAGWKPVKGEKYQAKAVPSGRTYRHHFGLSSTP